MIKKWTKPITLLSSKVRSPFAKIRYFIKQRFDWFDTPQILPYRGFGNRHHVFLKGHVLEAKALARPNEEDSIWDNMLAMLKRYVSDEVPGVRVRAEFRGQTQVKETDEYGMFEFEFRLPEDLPTGQVWHDVHLQLLDEVVPDQEEIKARGEIMICQHKSRFGIVSDIDDTFLISHSTSALKKIRLMLLKNANTRKPFAGVSAFYRALHHTHHPDYFNPIFYVSSSEWNLYDLLVDFCDHHFIPKGPFLLQSLKTNLLKLIRSGGGNHDHKLEKIRHILSTYKSLNFILIGDSGQRDAEIYLEIINEFPGRIDAVYIRDVSSKRVSRVQLISDQAQEHDVEMVLVENTNAAARHAIERGFIDKESLIDISRETFEDETAPTDFERIFSFGNKEDSEKQAKRD